MTATEVVNKFYELNNEVASNNATAESFRPLLSDDFVFKGPAMQLQGADNYVNLLKQFLMFHKSLEIIKQFSSGNEVCTITKLTLNSPAGKTIVMDIAEWCIIDSGKIKTHTIFYDPREFMEAFPMP